MKILLTVVVLIISLSTLAKDPKSCPNCLDTFVQPESSICSGWHFGIEPDMQITDHDLTSESTQESLSWLKENIDKQGFLYKLGKLNHQKVVNGYILKTQYINAKPDRKKIALESYCNWLREEGFWYD